jgi:exonuclease III
MKILCWNIRGWGQQDKRRQIKEFIYKEEVDMIGLQETMREKKFNR